MYGRLYDSAGDPLGVLIPTLLDAGASLVLVMKKRVKVARRRLKIERSIL